VDDVDRDLGDLFGAGAGGGQGTAEVGVYLAGLGGQVAGTDEVTVNVFGFLAGDEHHPGSGRDDDVGVGGGNGQVFGVDELECHSAFRPRLSMNRDTSLGYGGRTRQEAAVPSVLFLPDLFYDHRIWADLPASLGADGDAVCYDVHEPMPWGNLTARHSWVQAARFGLAGGLVLFQPAPDYISPEAITGAPVADLMAAAAPWAGLIDATAETDAARRAELVTRTWRDAYAGRLVASDVELACQVIAGHVYQVLATVTAVAAAAAAGAPPRRLGCPWVDRLAEISVPVTEVSARRTGRVGRAIACMAPDGRFIAATADTDLVWLEDRTQAKAAIRDMLVRLPA
jgi:hypothetical protein